MCFLFYRYTPKNCVNFEIEEEQQQPKSKQLKKFWDNNKKEIILACFFIVIFLITPFLLQLNLLGFSTWLKGFVRIGTPKAWFGFWGSYIGSILSIGFAYINSKIEGEQQRRNLEHQLEQNKINDLDNAIRKNEINHLTMILGELTDYISDIDYLLARIEEPVKDNQIMDLKTFEDCKNDFANTNFKYQKKWNKFILSYYNSQDVHLELTTINNKISNIYMDTCNNMLEYEQKINEPKQDENLLIPKLQEIFQNINELRKKSDSLRLNVLILLDDNKTSVVSMQKRLNSRI